MNLKNQAIMRRWRPRCGRYPDDSAGAREPRRPRHKVIDRREGKPKTGLEWEYRFMSAMYSIVIPAYNEGRRLGPTLDEISAFVTRQHWQAEIIVVNDGSRDNTGDVAREYTRRNPIIRVIDNPGNRGKGYSVRNGMLNAHGDVVLFSDADLSSPISEAPKLLEAIAAGADVAIGSRWAKPETQTERQSVVRQVFGRVYNIMLRTILGLRYKDTQCGFKAFTRGAARSIFAAQRVERWGFDPELLYLAKTFGHRVAEVPVAWAHVGNSKINPVRDGIRMFMEMVEVRWNGITGKYAKPVPTYAAKAGKL
jgi:glycosyltransferase involved in cell wall biosynthesis